MIWLIGCKGMLGSEIARQLNEKNISFTGTDIDVDITDVKALSDFAENQKEKITHIINCSAYTAVDLAESNEVLAKKLNEDGPGNIASVAKEINATMIHISTDYVFDGSENTPRTEDMAISPIGVYGVTKAGGEKALKSVLDNYYILRTAWLYGWAGKNFVYTMIKAMNSHDAIKVVDDQRGTPTFAGDLASVIINIINKELNGNNIPYGTYHCTDLGNITWHDFAVEIKKQAVEKGFITNKGCVVNSCTTEEYPTPAKRPAYSVLSKDKIQNALGIELPQWQDSLNVFLSSKLFDKSRIM